MFEKEQDSSKCIYDKQIRGLIGQEEKIESPVVKICNLYKMSRELEKQISQLDKLIDSQISEFNINIIKSSFGRGGVTDRQSFWKMKKLIAPRSKEKHCS